MPHTTHSETGPHEDWIVAQQLRAEIEAEAWRRVREEMRKPDANRTKRELNELAMALSQLDGAGRKSIRKSSVRGLWNVIVIAACPSSDALRHFPPQR